MGPWPVRELVELEESKRAAEDVETWGFPRTIEHSEIAGGYWFRMGQGVVWWYEPADERAPQYAQIHLAVAPRVRHHWPIRRWLTIAEAVAEMMGAESLLFAPVQKEDQIVQYALRLGWRPMGSAFVRDLGG